MSKKGKKNKTFDFDDDFDSAFDSKTGTTNGKCTYHHPVLSLGKGKLYGGSCSTPNTDQADVYVGLDSWMKFKHPKYPWLTESGEGPIEFMFKIHDMGVPADAKNFIAMIGWLKAKLEDGKTVHVGCMGGHGRTGMVLSAIVKEMTGNVDAIQWVRENYCKKAVESKEQVKFLMTHFGVSEAAPTKSHDHWNKKGGTTSGKYLGYETHNYGYGGMQGTLPLPRPFEADDCIPGTSIPRSRGPRDLALPMVTSGGQKPKSMKKQITVYPVDSTNSIWE